ncbi:helix-turn-helix domain-containing protein, partial [Streptomyces sp. Da 82-17]|uniref:helix-turn-helix domain-containing protein n=1 Tax=Streptomyces sp. Da 82-17 TaxID=3377116 RepID=UPI0038D503A0
MHDEPRERDAALADLRRLLTDALASARMTKTQLAAQSKLSRTTVQQAFQTDSSAPSAETVVALAHVLNLPMEKLLDLRRTAAGETGVTPGQCKGPGKPVHEWNPHDLEVHPAEPTLNEYPSGAALGPILPGYVPRDHDQILTDAVRDAAQGHSQMVVLVGASSTGKTRACWEAVQLLAKQGWRLWHPFDPTRAQAALAELKQVQPRTVVWLNEAQHYLGDPRVGEEIAAAIHSLLIHPERRPVLVLGTLWPEYDDEYTALPSPGKSDPHSRVRELLAGRTHTVPDAFDKEALRKAAALAQGGDWLLANALTRTRANGRVTQDLAGVPELLRRYERGTPPARAVLEAAMDARRLGVGLHLPQSFLIEATIDYLSDHDYDELAEDWAESAFAELARPTHGRQAPLRRTKARPQRRRPGSPTGVATSAPATGPVFRLADYLEQHGRATRQALCPPASFWHAAYTHLTDLDELTELAEEAESRCRFQWANHLLHRAADAGNASALGKLAYMREEAGDHDGAEELARQAAEAGNPYPLLDLTRMRKEDSRSNEALARQAADAGNSYALLDLARMRKKAGDQKGAAAFYYEAANAGHVTALVELAEMREEDGDRDAAEALARSVAHAGDTHGLVAL